MRTFISRLGYLILGLPLTMSVLLLAAMGPWALDRDFYKRTLTDDALYEALQDQALAKETDAVLTIGEARLDGPVLVAAAQKRLPVAELKGLATGAVDATFDWLEGAPGADTRQLDLKPLKKAIDARSAEVLRDYTAGIPAKPGIPDKGDYTYRPSSVSPSVYAAQATKAVRQATASGIPDTVAFPKGERPLITDGSGKSTSLPAGARQSTIGLGVFTSILLAGLSWLGGRRAVDRLRVAGNYLLLPSVLVLGVGAFLFFGTGLAGNAIAQGLPSLPAGSHLVHAPGSGTALFQWLSGLGREISKYFFLSGLVGTCAGGLLKSLRRTVDPERIE